MVDGFRKKRRHGPYLEMNKIPATHSNKQIAAALQRGYFLLVPLMMSSYQTNMYPFSLPLKSVKEETFIFISAMKASLFWTNNFKPNILTAESWENYGKLQGKQWRASKVQCCRSNFFFAFRRNGKIKVTMSYPSKKFFIKTRLIVHPFFSTCRVINKRMGCDAIIWIIWILPKKIKWFSC